MDGQTDLQRKPMYTPILQADFAAPCGSPGVGSLPGYGAVERIKGEHCGYTLPSGVGRSTPFPIWATAGEPLTLVRSLQGTAPLHCRNNLLSLV